MENTCRQGDRAPLEAVGQALAVPVLQLEAQGALHILWEAESPCEQLRDFTVATHPFLDDRPTLDQEGEESGDAAGELGVYRHISGEPGDDLGEPAGIDQHEI